MRFASAPTVHEASIFFGIQEEKLTDGFYCESFCTWNSKERNYEGSNLKITEKLHRQLFIFFEGTIVIVEYQIIRWVEKSLKTTI